MKKNIGIKVLSNACGVQPHSIRTWEARYNIFKPERTDGGQRLYSEEDLQKGKLISTLLNDGHAISKIANLSISDLNKLVKTEPSNKVRENLHTNISIAQLFKYLSSYNIDDVAKEIQYLRMNSSAKEFVFSVVLPVMQEIGTKVALGNYSVTQEHIISTIVRDQLGQLTIPNIGDMNRKIALATPDGNLHELSILIADIVCRSNRISTSYLGASHPAECLGEALNALKVSTVVMGVVSSDKWNYDKNIVKYLKDLDKHLKSKVEVVLGGGHEKDFPNFKNITNVRVVPDFETFDELLANYKIGN
ncbi:MerR family transcriptional regulator [Halobacteriovorax sp. HLS]|uniref:MerR family transcriptional regulator n=1 Tax=Halobacteriovorax sp. HLS TaxID=2234000 RepID=UPI000FD9205B|nr:MerR family transcriptional regulator [Halobacteriovorax sp. HLS]